MFLCKDHRQKLMDQPTEQLRQISQQWSEQAAMHYQFSRWDLALPYAGCAMEVCWLEAQKTNTPSLVLLTRCLCLAIYCDNMLNHLQDPQSGEAILAMNWQHVARNAFNIDDPELVKQCLVMCKDNRQHQQAIEQYTTWPFEPVGQQVAQQLGQQCQALLH